jgi:hypothetical protein
VALDTTSLALTVTDNLDGSVNWSVTGCGAGSSMTLFRAPWNVQAGGRMTWTEAATATANGSGVASGSNLSAGSYGFFQWMAVRQPTSTTADRLSWPVFRPVVDATATVHSRVLDAAVTLIRGLNLSGIGSATNKVFKRWFPKFIPGTDDATGAGGLPMIVVGPWPKELPMGPMTNRDDVGYPVMVGFFDSTNPNHDANMARNLKWRRQVAALFRQQQLSGVPEVVLCDWQPDSIAAPQWLDNNYMIGYMIFGFRSRETRGLVS